MQKFKIESAKKFKGLPAAIGTTTGQIVAPVKFSFNNGEEVKEGKIEATIVSRVYIDQTSCEEVEAKEAVIAAIKADIETKIAAHAAKVTEYNAGPTEVIAAEARAIHQEALDLETTLQVRISELETEAYYEHETKLEVDTLAELVAIEADVRAAVKADELFSSETLLDL